MEGTVRNTIISVKYTSTAKSTGTGSGIALSRVRAGVLTFQDMTSQTKRAAAAKPMEVESNQDTFNSTMPIIDALKMSWKHKKGWSPKQLGVKKVYENYDLYLANDYSQMRPEIFLRGETSTLLKTHRRHFCEAY